MEQKKNYRKNITKYTRKWLRGNNKKIKTEIVEKTSNVFLWVVIIMSLLNKIYDESRIENIKKILEEIPNGLEKLFSTILGQNVLKKAIIILMLQLVFFSREIFTAEKFFAAAIKIPFPNREIINRRITISFKNLIKIRKNEQGTV